MERGYPRPQFCRKEWQCLNGTWQFAYDDENKGVDEGWFDDRSLPMVITVPFAYQAKLSGIGDVTPHDIVWYKRTFVPENKKPGDRVILHFGAVDYEAAVYVNGCLVKEHVGGHTPFSADITPYLKGEGEQLVAVRACDPHRDEEIPRGKQFWKDYSEGIWYTNTTGIWQTVWVECVPASRLESVRFTSLFDEGKISIDCRTKQVSADDQIHYTISFEGEIIASGSVACRTNPLKWDVDIIQTKIFRTSFHGSGSCAWTPEDPKLHEVHLALVGADGTVKDAVDSYFGFRKVHTDKGMVYLNNRPYYQKLILDQGYWPGGLLTAPDDEALKQDILLSKAMGFNGCRKHQKMEDPRFLYWADKLGYIVWGECAAAPMYTEKSVAHSVSEWMEIIERDYNHPCILSWVPLNESWTVPFIQMDRMQQHFAQTMYHLIHSLDKTRLVVGNDGWEMTETDICAIHNYNHGQKHEAEKYAEYCRDLADREGLLTSKAAGRNIFAGDFKYQGQPILLTEYGGIGFDVSGEKGWGYTSVQDEESFVEDYARIMKAIYASDALWGYCYTQLTDVEQEINGLYTYDRKPKAAPERIKEINDSFHFRAVKE